jgi:hypothetical protein
MKVSDHEKALVRAFLAPHSLQDVDQGTAIVELAQIVAAIPWGEARTIEDVLAKKMGTCRGKHRLFVAALAELGIESRFVVSTFHWHEQDIHYPPALKEFLEDHHWPHNHTFAQVKNSNGAWVDCDLTWDPALKPWGFWTFPEDWDGEHSFHAVKVVDRWDGVEIEAKLDELKNLLSPEQQQASEHFLRLFIEWVASVR